MTIESDQKGILWLALDTASKQKLRSIIKPRYTNQFYHHITLRVDVPHAEVAPLVGTAHTATVYAQAYNNKVEAVRVTHNLPDTYGVPHITLSTDTGIPPFASVAMLRERHTEHIISPHFTVTGVIEFKAH